MIIMLHMATRPARATATIAVTVTVGEVATAALLTATVTPLPLDMRGTAPPRVHLLGMVAVSYQLMATMIKARIPHHKLTATVMAETAGMAGIAHTPRLLGAMADMVGPMPLHRLVADTVMPILLPRRTPEPTLPLRKRVTVGMEAPTAAYSRQWVRITTATTAQIHIAKLMPRRHSNGTEGVAIPAAGSLARLVVTTVAAAPHRPWVVAGVVGVVAGDTISSFVLVHLLSSLIQRSPLFVAYQLRPFPVALSKTIYHDAHIRDVQHRPRLDRGQ